MSTTHTHDARDAHSIGMAVLFGLFALLSVAACADAAFG